MSDRREESRRFPRVRSRIPLRYQARGTADFGNVLTDDLSLSGIGFIGSKFLPPQTAVNLEINVEKRVLHPIGRVVWSSPFSPNSDNFRSGIEFLEIDPMERKFLESYLEMRLKNN